MQVRSLIGDGAGDARHILSPWVPLNKCGTGLTWGMEPVCPMVPLDEGLAKSEQVRLSISRPGLRFFLSGEVVVNGTWPDATLHAKRRGEMADSQCLVYIQMEKLRSSGTLIITHWGGQVVRLGQSHSATGINLGALLILDARDRFAVQQGDRALFTYRWSGEELEVWPQFAA